MPSRVGGGTGVYLRVLVMNWTQDMVNAGHLISPLGGSNQLGCLC